MGRKGLQVYEFSEAIDQAGSYWSQWKNRHKVRETFPRADILMSMKSVLGVSLNYLLGLPDAEGEDPFDEETPEIQTVSLAELLARVGAKPVVGDYVEGLKLSAGPGSRVPDGFDDARPRKGKGKTPERIQVIEVEGQCMEPVLYAGDKVLVDTWQMPAIGQVVAAVRFHHDSIVKFLREKDGHQFFAGMDDTVIPLDQYTRVIGPVIDVQQSIWRRIAEAQRLTEATE